MTRELTGGHVLAITLAAFGTIIGVNLVMAANAISSFPGVETASPYIASQHFQAERAAQDQLGWQADLMLDQGVLTLAMRDGTGQGVTPRTLELMLRRPTHQKSDQQPRLELQDSGLWRAQVDLEPGAWNADLSAQSADGTQFRVRLPLISAP